MTRFLERSLSENQLHTYFYNIGVSYKKADAHTRGKYSLTKENQRLLLLEVAKKGCEGLFVLSTCNRTEITGFAEHPFQLIELLCKYSEGSVEEFAQISNIYKGKDAVNQLFRIGTGLESQILGDYEIVGQMKLAFKQAKKLGVTNAYLERLMNLVLQASKKVKNQTQLSSGTTSVSYAAIQYIIDAGKNKKHKNILVFGLGKMGKYTCKNLNQYIPSSSVTLINRTASKATEFVQNHPLIRQAKIEDLSSEIEQADVLIVSTGSDKPTVTKEHISKEKELLILDLSMPENVDTLLEKYPNITLVNIDKLSRVTDETLALRKKEIPLAEKVIEAHKEEFNEWLNHRRLTPAINALKESLEAIQKDELSYHRKKISNFNEEQAAIITNRFIQKITTQFVKHLKDGETSVSESIEVMTKVFGKV